tara:strand:+ start:40 stop:1314 length:1275 start_codon:yes stop_codon:yes gene_type:complete
MFNLINNFFYSSQNLKKVISEFKILKRTSNVAKIFKIIENHSDIAEIRYVGGCVRKIINEEKVDDIDLATNLNPLEVREVLKKNEIKFYETGIEHGTITAQIENERFEITSLRSDVTTDGRHAKVQFTKDWYKDAERRDFTINAIYSDLNGNLFDPFGGANDLKNGKLVFVGDADKRIREDYLRILRYIRFFAKYSKTNHNKNITKSINKNLSGISKISSDRLLDEFKKIFKSTKLDKICNDVFSYEIIKLIFPQFKGLIHLKNLNNSSYKKLNELDFVFLLSLLIIDETDNAEYFIYKFNISNKAKKRIFNLKNFYFNKNIESKINTKNLWKVFYNHGKETLNDILNYKIYTSRKTDNSINKYIDYFKDKKVPLFPIKGEDLMKKFNIPEGKKIGHNLKLIENNWLENDFKITEGQIKKIIKN